MANHTGGQEAKEWEHHQDKRFPPSCQNLFCYLYLPQVAKPPWLLALAVVRNLGCLASAAHPAGANGYPQRPAGRLLQKQRKQRRVCRLFRHLPERGAGACGAGGKAAGRRPVPPQRPLPACLPLPVTVLLSCVFAHRPATRRHRHVTGCHRLATRCQRAATLVERSATLRERLVVLVGRFATLGERFATPWLMPCRPWRGRGHGRGPLCHLHSTPCQRRPTVPRPRSHTTSTLYCYLPPVFTLSFLCPL